MAEQHKVDITELAVLGGQFPLRLMRLGFRLIQVIDDQGRDQFRYISPPVCDVPAGPFLMGSDPPQLMIVNAFALSTYPLTVAEFACFAQATNFDTFRIDR